MTRGLVGRPITCETNHRVADDHTQTYRHAQQKYYFGTSTVVTMANADTIMADVGSKPESKVDLSSLLQTPHCDAFAFSDHEKRILSLYDQLAELELEQALYQESQSTPSFHSMYAF